MKIISVAFVLTGLLTIALASPLRYRESNEKDLALLQMLLRNIGKLHKNNLWVKRISTTDTHNYHIIAHSQGTRLVNYNTIVIELM